MHLLTFRTRGFRDPDAIRHENVNDLEGHVLARTLQGVLRDAGWSTGDIEVEKRGWAFSVTDPAPYRIAAALEPEDEEDAADPDARAPDGAWMTGRIGIVRGRSFIDRLLGRGRLVDDDPVTHALLDELAAMTGVEGLVREAL